MGESGGGSSSTSQMIPLSHTAFSWACDGPTPLGHTLFSWRAGVRVQEGSSAQTSDDVDGDKSLSKGQRKVCGTSPLPPPPSHTKFSWTQQGTGAIPAGHTSFSWTGAQLILSHPAVSAARCWLLELDDNLLAEILGHLPVSSILSFASLSKRWGAQQIPCKHASNPSTRHCLLSCDQTTKHDATHAAQQATAEKPLSTALS